MLFLVRSCYFNDPCSKRGTKGKRDEGEGEGGKASAPACPTCTSRLPLLPAPSLPFSSLHESPFRSCFKNLTFNVLYHNRNPADQHQQRGPQFCYLFLVLNTPSNSKVFSSFITVFKKAKASPFKIPTCWVQPVLGSLGVTCPRQTTEEEVWDWL